jgi:hypothetical protein
MRAFRPLRVLRILVMIAVAVTVAGLAVMALWNWLLPPLTGWHSVSFPQALGLLILCRLLFGGFRGSMGPWMRGRWRHMSPEERERFREEMCTRFGRPPAESAQ